MSGSRRLLAMLSVLVMIVMMMMMLLLKTVYERTIVELMNHLVDALSTLKIRPLSKTRRQTVIRDSVMSHLFST